MTTAEALETLSTFNDMVLKKDQREAWHHILRAAAEGEAARVLVDALSECGLSTDTDDPEDFAQDGDVLDGYVIRAREIMAGDN